MIARHVVEGTDDALEFADTGPSRAGLATARRARQKPAMGAPDRSEWGPLMVLAQAGDAAAYRRLLGEVRPWLLAYYRRRLPPGHVDDAVQDAMIALHDKRRTFDPARPFGPWLAGIARYKWIDRLRAMGRAGTAPLPDDLAVEGHGDAVLSATVLDAMLATLKPAQAEVIRLVKLVGLSIEEAAARTGQSESLVKVNIHRGLARLAAAAAEEPSP